MAKDTFEKFKKHMEQKFQITYSSKSPEIEFEVTEKNQLKIFARRTIKPKKEDKLPKKFRNGW